jgi:two-component system sensor histidine kinase UhpB
LAGCLLKAQEEERRHIARELHDDVSQQIASLSISLSNIKRQLSPANSIAHQIQQVQEHAKSIANGVRTLSHTLHPVALEHVGLAAALTSLITEFGRSGVNFSLRVPEHRSPLPDHIAICLYRIAQESVRNIVKHSSARHAEIELSVHKSRIDLLIKDDGCGFEIEEARKKGGLGLISMAERVSLLQGVFEIRTSPGDGTFLRARVPLTNVKSMSRGASPCAR